MAKNNNNEVGTLDTIVDKYSIRIEVCTNQSKHIDRGMNIPSDMMFEHDTMFLTKRIAAGELGIDTDTIRSWSPDDCKNFYQEHNMGLVYKFSENFMTGTKSLSKWYFEGRSEHYMRFLEYRWNQGMVFTSYRERVDAALQSMIDNQTESTNTIIDKIQDLEEQKAVLNGELETLVRSEAISDRLKTILSDVKIDFSDL
jgi:hypothetical protein